MDIEKNCIFSSNDEISELRDKCKKLRDKIKSSVIKISELVSSESPVREERGVIVACPEDNLEES